MIDIASVVVAIVIIFLFFGMIWHRSKPGQRTYTLRDGGSVDVYRGIMLTARNNGDALLEQHHERVNGRTYTVVLPKQFSDFDEFNHARILAQRGGNDICSVPFTENDVLRKWKS